MKIALSIDGLYAGQSKSFGMVAEVSPETPTEGVATAIEELAKKAIDEVFYIKTGRTLEKTQALNLRNHLSRKGVEMNPDPNLTLR
jgi:hypothetical protein